MDFKDALEGSDKAVEAFADYLRNLPREVVITPRFHHTQRHGGAEDIKSRMTGGEWKRFEVKGRNLQFTCREDFPYPDIIVDRATKTHPMCDWYVTVSKDLQYAAIVDGKTSDSWRIEEIFDHTKGYSTLVYLCDIDDVEFRRIAGNEKDRL